MQFMDTDKAEQVWKRVRGQSPDFQFGKMLQEMVTEERTDAAIYLNLSRKLTGREGALLQQMFEEEQSHIACLKGIYTIITGAKPNMPRVFLPQGNLDTVLRTCYGREMRGLAAYEAKASDPEYGPVFMRLAQQEQEHCRRLLEILGNLKR